MLIEFRCPECGNRMESIVHRDEPQEATCFAQGRNGDFCLADMERVFSAPALKVKGGTPKFHGGGRNG